MATLAIVEGEIDELIDDVFDDFPVREGRFRLGIQPLDRICLQGVHAGRIAGLIAPEVQPRPRPIGLWSAGGKGALRAVRTRAGWQPTMRVQRAPDAASATH